MRFRLHSLLLLTALALIALPLTTAVAQDDSGDTAAQVQKLIEQLNADESSDRIKAANALAKMGPAAASAADALGKQLNEFRNGQTDVRVAVLDALRAFGTSAAAAVPHILVALERDDEFVNDVSIHRKALEVITAIGPEAKGAVDIVVTLIKRGAAASHGAAMEAAGSIGPAASAAVPVLRDTLEDAFSVEALRISAVMALGKIGSASESAVPALVKILGDANASSIIRRPVATALGQIGEHADQAVPALAAVLTDADIILSWHAARALRGFGEAAKSAVSALARVLKHPNNSVRQASATTLGHIGSAAAAALPALKDAAANDSDDKVKAAATTAIEKIGG